MRVCPVCGGRLESRFRFCPWCAAPQRLKLTEFFLGDPRFEDGEGKAMRLSRYLAGHDAGAHVRVSVWDETGTAESVVALSDAEAERAGRFLVGAPARTEPRPTDWIRQLLRL